MCPPARSPPPTNISNFWTEEELFMSLEKFNSGCPLPSNVTADINPYQINPSNLPEDIWYFCSNVGGNAEHGFWKARGEECEIFSNSGITGWRTTFEYYEGQSPYEQRTNWVMQEYKITERGIRHKTKPKDASALCRVFLADLSTLHLAPASVQNTRTESGQNLKGETLEKEQANGVEPVALTGRSQDPSPENGAWGDYFLRGDYIALEDLADLESRSSSSVNSSSMSFSSKEYFDPSALLRHLENGTKDHHGRQCANVNFNLSAPVISKEVIMQPATLGSLVSGNKRKSPTEQIPRPDYSITSQQEGLGNDCISSSCNMEASSSGPKSIPRREQRDLVTRVKALKKRCFWFMPF